MIWHEHRGKYGELRFLIQQQWKDEYFHLFIAFDDETRDGYPWRWSVHRFPVGSWNWKDATKVDGAKSKTLHEAQTAAMTTYYQQRKEGYAQV